MILKLDKDIVTRYQVERLTEANPDVSEVDFSAVEVYSASAMHEMMLRYPVAKFTGMTTWTEKLFEDVIEMCRQIEERKNDTG